jgi:hypothetical protein
MASSLLSLRRRAEERREVPRSEVAEISFGSWMEVADAVERRRERITENFIVAVCCFCCFVCTVLISFRVVGTLFPSVGECLLFVFSNLRWESVVCVGTSLRLEGSLARLIFLCTLPLDTKTKSFSNRHYQCRTHFLTKNQPQLLPGALHQF